MSNLLDWVSKLVNIFCRYLYNLLCKNQQVTEQNRSLLVETLRSISEILIWGDQNDSSVFEYGILYQISLFRLFCKKKFYKISNFKFGALKHIIILYLTPQFWGRLSFSFAFWSCFWLFYFIFLFLITFFHSRICFICIFKISKLIYFILNKQLCF